MSFTAVLAFAVLLVGVPLNAYVMRRLLNLHRASPDISVLRERLIVAVVVLFSVLLFGLIFVNNDTLPPPLGLDVTKVITRLTILALAIVPALYWLRLYR